jgi:hypothetical protein
MELIPTFVKTKFPKCIQMLKFRKKLNFLDLKSINFFEV